MRTNREKYIDTMTNAELADLFCQLMRDCVGCFENWCSYFDFEKQDCSLDWENEDFDHDVCNEGFYQWLGKSW